MKVLIDKNDIEVSSKANTEQVQFKKQEYYLLGTFLRTKGLLIFGYDFMKDELLEIKIKYSNTIHVVPIDGILTTRDYEAEKCMVDSRLEYFEALNKKTAKDRIDKYKAGKIPTLCNLKKYNPEGIKLW